MLGSTSAPSEGFFPKSPHSPLTAGEREAGRGGNVPASVYRVWETCAQVISVKETDIPRTIPKGMPLATGVQLKHYLSHIEAVVWVWTVSGGSIVIENLVIRMVPWDSETSRR